MTPTEVPVRANIAALKSIGVEVIIAFSAVGSLREEIPPCDFVLPDQLIDRTVDFILLSSKSQVRSYCYAANFFMGAHLTLKCPSVSVDSRN